MKKENLKYKFVELRAMGYTYANICKELDITKPTAIKWGKLFSTEINRQQKYLLSTIFAQGVVEQEQGILINLEQLRRSKTMQVPKETLERLTPKMFKRLEKVFAKKITAIHLNMNNDRISGATFIFNDDVKVNEL
jgi:hypothetical protein